MPPNSESHRWRLYLRLSVRGLLTVVLVCGASLGWLVRSARIQRDAVAAITKSGGFVRYNWEWSDEKENPGGAPWPPRWLVNHVGVDYFGRVSFVELPLYLTRKSSAERFAVVPDRYDLIMPQVGRLSSLVSLECSSSSVSDVGLAQIKGLTNLKTLNCSNTKITDAGLAHLHDLRRLSTLQLIGNQITDAGLANVGLLSSLSELNLTSTQITDAGLAHLHDLSRLSILKLNYDQITDAGLRHLKGLTNLTELELSHTQVTNAGLVHLIALTKLSKLGLFETRVTAVGRKELLRALPNLKIDQPFAADGDP